MEAPAMAQVGLSSTRPGFSGETGIDTLRLLFETERSFKHEIIEDEGWRFGSIEALGLTWAEGRPCADRLARPDDVLRAGSAARASSRRQSVCDETKELRAWTSLRHAPFQPSPKREHFSRAWQPSTCRDAKRLGADDPFTLSRGRMRLGVGSLHAVTTKGWSAAANHGDMYD
jgi:hypothetical protein